MVQFSHCFLVSLERRLCKVTSFFCWKNLKFICTCILFTFFSKKHLECAFSSFNLRFCKTVGRYLPNPSGEFPFKDPWSLFLLDGLSQTHISVSEIPHNSLNIESERDRNVHLKLGILLYAHFTSIKLILFKMKDWSFNLFLARKHPGFTISLITTS